MEAGWELNMQIRFWFSLAVDYFGEVSGRVVAAMRTYNLWNQKNLMKPVLQVLTQWYWRECWVASTCSRHQILSIKVLVRTMKGWIVISDDPCVSSSSFLFLFFELPGIELSALNLDLCGFWEVELQLKQKTLRGFGKHSTYLSFVDPTCRFVFWKLFQRKPSG